jgi:penicillin-binding protein 2
MANQIKDDGIYVFDQDHVDTGTVEKHGNTTAVRSFFTSRYAIIGMILCTFGVIILAMTASLQFSDIKNHIVTSSEGVSRQYTVSAPRGNITDCNGVMLASTEEVNTLMIADAGMSDEDFNAMLLDLSYLFDKYNVVPVADLPDYLTIEPYAFQKTADEITAWQVSKNLFSLKEPTTDSVVTYTDKFVKSDPQIFFLFLRNQFNIDKSYSEEDAYRIMQIRYQIFEDNWAYTTGTPVKIATDVPQELINYLLEQNYKYMGIVPGKDYRRVYSPQAEISSHVIGYVGKISQESFAKLSNMGYSLDDIIGQIGMEYQMERYLHGQSGTKAYNIWTTKGDTGSFFPENIGTDPVPGANVTLTIDTRLQKVAMDALKDYIAAAAAAEVADPKGYATASAGAVVALDVKTGEIKAMISYPNYDPSDFVLAMEGDAQAKEQVKYYLGLGDYKKQTDLDKPLFDRAIQAQYAPGSTFKMVTAVAALETGIITPESNTYVCKSPIYIGGWLFKCHEFPNGPGHGPLTLTRALAVSCNIYFQLLGVDTGIDAIDKWGKTLGLGELTGVDLPGEITGIRASRETKRLLNEKVEDKTWFPADTAQSAIGQFDNCFTILQLARYTAALATNTLVTPHVIKNVTAEDGTVLYSGSTKVTPLNIKQSTLDAIRTSMKAVITDSEGTANKYLSDFPVTLACKTGTAETGFEYIRKEYSNGLFVCYAPADNPQIAIAIVVEKGEWGASTTIIARKLLLAYFGLADPANTNEVDSDATIGDVPAATITPTPAA